MSEKEIWECLDEAILNMVQREDLSEKGLYLPADTDDPYTHTHTHTHSISVYIILDAFFVLSLQMDEEITLIKCLFNYIMQKKKH